MSEVQKENTPPEQKPDVLHDPYAVLKQENVEWRDGKPNYDQQKEAFEKGKSRDHDPDSLEAIVQCLVKNFEKEASNIRNPNQFQTIDIEKFRIINNGGTSYDVKKMVEIGTYNVFLEDCPKHLYDPKCTFEESHSMFHKCFSKSFAWEVIEVFSGPPVVTFSWRHWGEYSGPYKNNQPTGKIIELYGMSVAHVNKDTLKIESIQSYFDTYKFLSELDYTGCKHAGSGSEKKTEKTNKCKQQ